MTPIDLTVGTEDSAEELLPGIILTFVHLPKVALDRFSARIAHPEPLSPAPRVTVTAAPPGVAFVAHVTFGGHNIRLAGYTSAVPKQVAEHAVVAAWHPQEQKDAILRHAAHVRCDYEGGSEDAVEQHIALYKVAWGFAEAGLTGVLNENAWTCQPAAVLPNLMAPAALPSLRQKVPPLLWTGMAKIPYERGVWFISRGNGLFRVPDFAFLAGGHSDAEAVLAMFSALFAHIRETKEYVQIGGQIQIGAEEYLQFSEAPYHLGLHGTGGRLLEVEKVSGGGLARLG